MFQVQTHRARQPVVSVFLSPQPQLKKQLFGFLQVWKDSVMCLQQCLSRSILLFLHPVIILCRQKSACIKPRQNTSLNLLCSDLQRLQKQPLTFLWSILTKPSYQLKLKL